MKTDIDDRVGTVAVVVAAGFEDRELTDPVHILETSRYHCELIGIEAGESLEGKRGETVVTSKAVKDCSAADYDALLIPGGYSPDKLRTNETMVDFVRDFCASGKPVAAICHGPQLLIEAGVVSGRRMTSWPSVRTDLINAGAQWEDSEVVVDERLITSRKPADLGAFTQALIKALREEA